MRAAKVETWLVYFTNFFTGLALRYHEQFSRVFLNLSLPGFVPSVHFFSVLLVYFAALFPNF